MGRINFTNFFLNSPWEMEAEPFQVSPHIYFVGTSYVSCYLVVTDDGLLLIDQGFSETAYMLFESIRKLGFDPKCIKHLFISHAHVDHCGGTRVIKEYTGAKIYISKEDYTIMKEHPSWVSLGNVNFLDFDADCFFSDEKIWDFGTVRINTKLTPGHTPGTTSFFIIDKDSEGHEYRVAMHGGLGFNTIKKEFWEEYPDWPRDLAPLYQKSLLSLLGEKVDIPIPSHPPQLPFLFKSGTYKEGEANPFIDRSAFEEMVKARLEMVKEYL